MHILFLTDNFPPEVNAPASRTYEHCREWVKAGHEVTVITCVPNFPQGKIYDGYRNRLWQSEAMDGIRVVRVWSYITANEGFVKRVLDYQSYMVAATLASVFVRRVDIVVGTSPQLFTTCAAWVVSLLKRIPYVFELRDLWPESIKAVGAMKDSPATRALERLELLLYRKAAVVVSVTQAFKSNLVSRGIENDKIHVVTNGVDLSRFSPRPRDPGLEQSLGLKGKFVAGYIGTHGMAHGLDTLLDTADQLQKTDTEDRFRILFLGNGAARQALIDRAGRMGLRNVVFIESVPKDDVVRYWSLLDASIIHLRKTELFTTVIPSKLFESMGMGIPVLLGVHGEAADILEGAGAGVCFEPENATALAQHIETLASSGFLYAKYAQAGVASAKLFDRAQLAKNMLEVLHDIVGIEFQPAKETYADARARLSSRTETMATSRPPLPQVRLAGGTFQDYSPMFERQLAGDSGKGQFAPSGTGWRHTLEPFPLQMLSRKDAPPDGGDFVWAEVVNQYETRIAELEGTIEQLTMKLELSEKRSASAPQLTTSSLR